MMSPAAQVPEIPFRRVSIVVVAGACRDELVRCLTSLAPLRFPMVTAPAVDVLVVADEAVADRFDAAALAAVAGREVRVATTAGGPGEAIAVALDRRHPDAEVVAFLDGDRTVVPTWLDHHLATIVAHDADVSVGPQLLRLPEGDAAAGAGISGAAHVMRRETGTRLGWAASGNLVVRMAAVADVDIDRRFGTAADAVSDWTFRLAEAGARLVWADRAVVWRRVAGTVPPHPVVAGSEGAGLRWTGPVMGWSGYGELARALIVGAERAGLACAVASWSPGCDASVTRGGCPPS